MNEDSLNREPIELVEIVLPKCANVYGTAPCTASGTRKCYNTRATCVDPDNYRDTPDRHLTAGLTLTNGDTISSTDLDREADLFAAFTTRFDASAPDGIIWEQGDTTQGPYLGIDSGNLIFEMQGTADGQISVAASAYAGKTVTLYIGIDFTASSPSTISLWVFDPVELTNTRLGTASFTPTNVWASGLTTGYIGTGSGTSPGGYPLTDWNGGTITARFYSATPAPSDMGDSFRQELWLGRGQKGEPTNEKYILPCLSDLGTISTRINLSGSDLDYEPLGRRATLDFSCADFTHSDITQDPYLNDRGVSPKEQGTFWRKWLRRQRFGKTGALVRVHDGYANELLEAYKTRTYVLDKVNYNEDSISFHCRDILTRTEFRKAQIPAPSSGILNAAMDTSQTTMDLTGDVTADYPATGTVRINDEIITYTGRSASGSPTTTTFTGLSRAQDGSEADEHSINDLVQLCRRYTSASITDVVTEWLTVDAEIEGQLIALADLATEVTSYLDAYNITTLITEPTGVGELLGRLSQECSFYIWWDERVQQIRLRAIRAIGVDEVDTLWTYEDNILANSLKIMEKPKERLNVITFYYNPANWTEDLDKAANFKNGLKLINGTTSLPEQYGNIVQTREIYSIFLTTEAEANQTSSRLANRYADVPTFLEFYVDAKDRAKWAGDIVKISHPMIIDQFGDRKIQRYLIIEAEEVDPGHLVRYLAADITLDGTIYLITENTLTTYDEEDFAAGNAFITDNNGLNPDGTIGATIS